MAQRRPTHTPLQNGGASTDGTRVTALASPRARARALAWLVGNAADRARFTAMRQHFHNTPVYAVLVGGTNCLAATVYGGWLLVLIALAFMTMLVSTLAVRRSTTPEVPVVAAFVLLELNDICAVLLSGGADSPLLPLTFVPLFTQAVSFRPAVSIVGAAASGVLVVVACAVAPLLPTAPVAPSFLHVVVYLAVLGGLGLAAHNLAGSDSDARGTASLDPLTGLFNRRALTKHFADTCARTGVSQAAIGLIMIDIDHFKAVNDTHGHERGDQVLQEVAQRLTRAARAGDLVYRAGGEEFVVLAPGADAAAAEVVAERLRAVVSSEQVCGLQLTVSAGVCSVPAEAAELDVMSRSADDALYLAKRDGRDRVVVAQSPQSA